MIRGTHGEAVPDASVVRSAEGGDLVSVVIPVFNESGTIREVVSSVSKGLEAAGERFEILLVDDGSTDSSWTIVGELSSLDSRVRGIRFTRNFGKEAALWAGMDHAVGAAVVTMDADMQHPPHIVNEMLEVRRASGCSVIEAVKRRRGRESAIYRWVVRLFYRVFHRATGVDIDDSTDFKVLDRRVVDALLRMREPHSFFRATIAWMGFRTERIPFDVPPRTAGKSGWSPRALLALGVSGLIRFSSLPVQAIAVSPIVYGVAALAAIAVARASGEGPEGGSWLPFVLVVGTGVVITIDLAILALYAQRALEEARPRPLYLVEETLPKSAAATREHRSNPSRPTNAPGGHFDRSGALR